MADRLKRVTLSEKKRNQAQRNKKFRSRTINIRTCIVEWKEIREEMNLTNDHEVAEMLIKCYRESQRSDGHAEKIKRKKRITSTPALQHVDPGVSPDVSSVAGSSDGRTSSLMSGMDRIESSQSESEIRVHNTPPVRAPPADLPTQAATISFEELSMLDAGALQDEDDETYVPSEWNISINVPEPEGEEVVCDGDITDLIHDIEDLHEEPEHMTSGKVLKTVGRDEMQDPLYVVAQSHLLQLASLLPIDICKTCDEPLEIQEKKNGSAVVLNWVCEAGHVTHMWTSQPILRHGSMLGNVKLLSSILLSGNHYRKIALMCKFANLGLPSQSAFTRLQSHYLVPSINKFWTREKETVQEELRATNVVVSGDGRMDSPGHCAKFCTYTVMSQKTKQILAMEIVDKRECQLVSNRMEAVAFQRAMTDMDTAGIIVDEFVSDAHPQVSSIMKKNYPQIKHSWDMWHGAKNLGKKLCAASQEKGKGALKPWISPVTNHFFHAAETCRKDEMRLKTKLLSVVNHCVNRHEWALGQCDHGELTEERDKEWLTPNGPEVRSLQAILLDTRFQNSMKYYVTCQSTSELETFNNHLLMYAPKRTAFSYGVYKCRCQLAALDYMKHIDRPYQKNKKGEQCYNRIYSKAANHWSAEPVKEKKKYLYISDILMDVFDCYNTGEEKLRHKVKRVAGDPAAIAPTIAPIEPPATKDLAKQQKARLGIWMPGTSSTVVEAQSDSD